VARAGSTDSGAPGGESKPDYLRPERLVLAATWLGFFGVAAVIAPSGPEVNAYDVDFVRTLISQPFSGAVNPILEAQFNSLGVIPAVYLSLLLPGSKDQKPLPALLFVIASFALGFGSLAPYLIARQQREEPVKRSELGWYCRTVAESKINAALLTAFALYLVYYGAVHCDAAALSEYASIWSTKSALCCVSSVDLLILSAAMYNPMTEDCARRGWEPTRAAPFCLLPVVGPAVYLLLRPSLEE